MVTQNIASVRQAQRGMPGGRDAIVRANRYTPAVPKNILLFVAALVWVCVGTALLWVALSWLAKAPQASRYALAATGVAVALIAHHFGFLRIVDRNTARILAMEGKRCFFSFVPWRSYLLVAVMIAMGAILRHSAIPKPYLAVLYIGMGLALLLSSVRYLRIFSGEIRRGHPT